MVEPLLLTTRQVAAALNLSERTVYALLASGQLPSVQIGRARRVRRVDLEWFIDQLSDLRDPTETSEAS